MAKLLLGELEISTFLLPIWATSVCWFRVINVLSFSKELPTQRVSIIYLCLSVFLCLLFLLLSGNFARCCIIPFSCWLPLLPARVRWRSPWLHNASSAAARCRTSFASSSLDLVPVNFVDFQTQSALL